MGLFYFILIQSQWPPQETPPSIGQRNGLPSSWPPGLASWPPKLASWPPKLASSENLYFILIQSPWPPQETPPSIGRRNGLPSSWPPELASWPPNLASSGNLSFILIQSPWPPQETPPQYWTTGRPPELLA